jgi:hypothetical protein
MPAVAASQKLTGEVTAPKNTTTTTKSSSSSLYTFPSGERRNRPRWVWMKNARLLTQSAAVAAFLSNSKSASGVRLSGD